VAEPVVSSVVARATSPEQVGTDAEAAMWGVYREDLEEIDRISYTLPAV
jgi:hypothetical protein